jgi:sensor histidine kinase YesM
MLDRLDSFLRETLSSSRSASNTLAHEFQVLEDYLELMGVRLGNRLQYELKLAEDCKALSVPSLILQPLVENAIRHGIEPEIDGGTLLVSASRQQDFLTLVVSDTGSGMPHSAIMAATVEPANNTVSAGGFGLHSLRERLQDTFADTATLTIASSATDPAINGTQITISLPIGKVE